MKLTAENVHTVVMSCLYKAGEDTTDHIKVEGVWHTLGFDPKRVDQNKETIIQLLQQLPDSFKSSGGGGYTFLNMCDDANGDQWTGEHESVDRLVCLGMAIRKASFLMPREMWEDLPGGMPYVRIEV